MSEIKFVGMLLVYGGGLVVVLLTICKPLVTNTKQMTKLTERLEALIDRMDRQEKDFEKHRKEFEEYKVHVSNGQQRQWDEINRQHDILIEQKADIEHLKKGGEAR